MSDEQINLLQEILAELKASNQAASQFRAEVQSDSATQRSAWLEEVARQREHGKNCVRLFRGMLVVLLLGVISVSAIFAWSVGAWSVGRAPASRPSPNGVLQLEPLPE